jgi:thymidylate kinase
VIILEGPDGSGKTQLAKWLAEVYQLTYLRYPRLSSVSGPDGPGIIEWWDEQIAANDPTCIYDRCFYISEPIYQLATPGRELIADPQVMVHGVNRLANFAPFFIFCLPPWEVTLSNIGTRDRLDGVDDAALKKIWWAYHTAYAHWSEILYHTVMVWDYTQDKEEHVLERIDNYRRRM